MTTWRFPSMPTKGLVLIVGLGDSGFAAARWCAAHGVAMRIVDTRHAPPALQAVQALTSHHKPEIHLGAEAVSPSVLADVGLVVVSPGISPDDPDLGELLHTAMANGVEVVGEIELFARALGDMAQQGYKPDVVAVTGTNGKTTVTALVRSLAASVGRSVVAAGNIGPTALGALLDAMEARRLPDLWALELSSFQLATTHSLHSQASVVLNIAQDHIDWHGSFDAYVAAKARAIQQTDQVILNRDDACYAALLAYAPDKPVHTFGNGLPRGPDEFGLHADNGVLWLYCGQERLVPADALRIPGRHNALNALAALALLRAVGLPVDAMLDALRDYTGEPHRFSFIRAIAGVDFIDDSKGTNVSASVAALHSVNGPTVLIAGGLAKGQDFAPLAQAAKAGVHHVVLIGKDVRRLSDALSAAGVPTTWVATMAQAVRTAFGLAQGGDSILLSPACASMDLFKDYVHRGQCFIDAVNELALEHGEVA